MTGPEAYDKLMQELRDSFGTPEQREANHRALLNDMACGWVPYQDDPYFLNYNTMVMARPSLDWREGVPHAAYAVRHTDGTTTLMDARTFEDTYWTSLNALRACGVRVSEPEVEGLA